MGFRHVRHAGFDQPLLSVRVRSPGMVVDVSKVRQVRRWAGRRFRMHGETDPAPDSRHLAKVCAWGALLGLGGVAVALRALIRLAYDAPGWAYLPALVLIALVGLASAIAAF